MKSSPIPALLLLALSAVVVLTLQLMPSRSAGQLAVIYPPGESFDAYFQHAVAAGAQVVRSGVTPNIVIVYGGDADRLYQYGALIVVNAVVEGGCILSPRRVS